MEIIKHFNMTQRDINSFLNKYEIEDLEKIEIHKIYDNFFFDNFYLRIIKLHDNEIEFFKKSKKTEFPILRKLTLLKPKDEIFSKRLTKDIETSKLSNLHIFLTTDCNLRCIYCFACGGENKNEISTESAIEFIKKTIDKNNDKIKISFFAGGEPTLAIDKIKKIIEFITEEYPDKNFELSIQTNGIFDEEIREFLIRHFKNITISCDGIPEIQLKQRPSPFLSKKDEIEILENNIKELSKKKAVGVRATLTKASIKKIIDSALYFYKLGIRNMHFEPITIAGRALRVGSEYSTPPDTENMIDKLIQLNEYSEILSFRLSKGSILPLVSRFSGEFCGACGKNFCLTTDNFISTCYEVTNFDNSHESEIFIIGKFKKNNQKYEIEWYKDRFQTLLKRNIYNIPKCKKCEFRYGCGGYCPIRILRETNDIFTPSEKICNTIKKYAYKFLENEIKKFYMKTPYLIKEKEKYIIKWITAKIGGEDKINIIYYEITIPDELEKLYKLKNKINNKKINILFLKPLFKCANGNYIEMRDSLNRLNELIKNLDVDRVILPSAPPLKTNHRCLECWFWIKEINGKIFTCEGFEIEKNDIVNNNLYCIEKHKVLSKINKNNRIIEKCKLCTYRIRKKCNGISYCLSL